MGMLPQIAIDEVMGDGRPKRTRLGFSVGSGFGVELFVLNNAGTTLTTGAIVICNGNLYCRRI